MITRADTGMVPALKTLWKDSFNDGDGYIDFFFDNRFKPENTFVYLKNGSPVSMASAFDAEIYHDGQYTPIWYVYAVATAADYRKEGLSSALLEHIRGLYPSTFLVPSSETLFGFYEKRGYKPAFAISEVEISLEEMCAPDKAPVFGAVSAEEYKTARDARFRKEGYIRWDTEAVAYALAENAFQGGEALKVRAQGGKGPEGVILFNSRRGRLFVTETTLPPPDLRDAAFFLMKRTGAASCRVRFAPDAAEGARPFGMLRSEAVSVDQGYCNLVLD